MFNFKNMTPGKKLNSVLRRRLIIHKVDKAKKGLSRRMTVRSLSKKMMQRNLLYQRILHNDKSETRVNEVYSPYTLKRRSLTCYKSIYIVTEAVII